jgi:hypothetical protein
MSCGSKRIRETGRNRLGYKIPLPDVRNKESEVSNV